MTYLITGLAPEPFAQLFDADEAALAAHNAVRVIADAKPGYPCRISLDDAEQGEELILVNHVSHDVAGPFRTAYAIYVRAGQTAPTFADAVPPYLDRRTLGLRGFDTAGMLRNAVLAMPGEADSRLRALFTDPRIATIHAHNAAQGCFLAKVGRA